MSEKRASGNKLNPTLIRDPLIISILFKVQTSCPQGPCAVQQGWRGAGSQDSPVSDADHALLSDDRGAPVMSGGAWLTQDPVLPGRTGLLTQVSADDNDVEPRTLPCSALASCAGK